MKITFIITFYFGLFFAFVFFAREENAVPKKSPPPILSPVAKHTPSGCAPVLHGRPLMRFVFRESDLQEPVLVCFYAAASALRSAAGSAEARAPKIP